MVATYRGVSGQFKTFLSQLILSLDADILGLQEVRLEVETPPYSSHSRKRQRKTKPSNTECQVCDFAELLSEYQFVYQPAMLYMERLMERKEEGLAILSRYPILSSDYKLLYRYTLHMCAIYMPRAINNSRT